MKLGQNNQLICKKMHEYQPDWVKIVDFFSPVVIGAAVAAVQHQYFQFLRG